MPINIHIAAGVDAAGVGAAANWTKTAWPSLPARAHKPVNSVQMELANSRFVSNLLLSDLAFRWPDVKWVSVESGIGWLPYVFERVDYEFLEDFPSDPAPDRPSAREMFQKNCYATFWFENTGPQRLLDVIGIDNVMWETDFPHPTCLHPDAVRRSAEVLGSLGQDVLRKVVQDTAANLYNIDVSLTSRQRTEDGCQSLEQRMIITDAAAMEWERLRTSSRNMRTSRKLLREGEALPGVGLYALLVKLHEGAEKFTAPRHRHNFSQIRIGLRGQMDFGPGLECEPGEVGFFPGGAHYGPEEINGAEYLLLQWGREWVTRAQDKQAMAELSRRGRFEQGLYYYEEDGAEKSIDGKTRGVGARVRAARGHQGTAIPVARHDHAG